MYLIIFSIDKNYELYQELKERGEMVVYVLKKFLSKNPTCPLKKGESLASPNHQL